MFEESPDRGPPVSLRGWLSDIYFPVLVDDDEKSVAALLQRLGSKATVDNPIFGRANGIAALERSLADVSAWLKAHKAVYAKTHFTTGVDRDVTEGSLSLTFESKTRGPPGRRGGRAKALARGGAARLLLDAADERHAGRPLAARPRGPRGVAPPTR